MSMISHQIGELKWLAKSFEEDNSSISKWGGEAKSVAGIIYGAIDTIEALSTKVMEQNITHEIRTETHGVCSDVISRQAAINKIWDLDEGDPLIYRFDVLDTLESLPSADRPKGEWIPDGPDNWKCSTCGYGVEAYNNTAFCPRCGTDMRRTEEK